MKLFSYQESAVKKLKGNKGYLLAYDMGLGKTIIALAAAKSLKKKTLVVAPAFMKKTWEKTILEHFSDIKKIEVISWHSIKGTEEAEVVIFDESHYMKNPEALRSKAALKITDRVREKNGFVWCLSGTPAKNTAAELFVQFKAMGQLKDYESYEQFADEFSNKSYVRYGNMYKPQVKYQGVRNVEKLRTIYSPFMEVLKSSAVLELPQQVKSQVYSDVSVFSEEDLRLYIQDPEGANHNEHFSAKKALQAKMNVETTIAKVAEILENDNKAKVVVFSDHVETTDLIAKQFDCEKITGAVSMHKREKAIDAFKKYDKVLACTIGAAGVGLNLQFANYMVFNDLPWVPADLQQAEKRIHRIGQTERCFYYYVMDSGLGEMIYKTLQEKILQLREIK